MTSKRSSKISPANSSGTDSSAQEKQDREHEMFPIVGMGASAGGIEAFSELLSHLPSDTGMGFVLIQHMSPSRKSMLAEILSRKTLMPVTEAENGMPVEPNHVYVIPPNTIMTIAAGKLKLIPRHQTHGISMTVDSFFVSLAESVRNRAIGVVLSGGDGDGARGLEAIKGMGGITFAQTDSSARVSSMPNVAIATGYVDFILTPQQIAEELANISRHPYIRSLIRSEDEDEGEGEASATEDSMLTIFALLRAKTGVDFNRYKRTTLHRRIMRRMTLYKVKTLEEYVKYLQNNLPEISALYQDMLITVTAFFRDPAAFEVLKTKVFPALVQERDPNQPLRIWVAGCSTGEEAYSIGICLLEFLTGQGINIPVQIFATDINEVAIEKARSGIYRASQVADISPERLQRFFNQVDGGYQISKAVRELCVFARQNLIGDPPFSRMDLISCRNLLIYLDTSVQKKLLQVFLYGLKLNGFLILGTSETVSEFVDFFTVVDKKYKIYFRKMATARMNLDLITSGYNPENIKLPIPYRQEVVNEMEIQKQADQIVLNYYAPVGVVVNNDLEILQFRGQTSLYLEPAPGRPSFNLFKMAKEELRLELRTAIYQAKKQEKIISREGLQIRQGDQVRHVKFDVIPFKPKESQESYFLVLFADTGVLFTPTISVVDVTDSQIEESVDQDVSLIQQREKAIYEQEINRLNQELATTRNYLQSIIEEQQATNQDLRAANEESLSSNEELQSTNEELETAKEEIQSTNEELNTINDELQRLNLEAAQVSNDLQNLLSSINIPILMLGGDLQIRRYTPVAEKIFNLIPSDVGRPLSDIKHKLNVPDLEAQILEVISTLNLKAQEVQDQDGHWYDLRIRPYRTIENRIDGAVVVLVDIDDLKRSSEQLKASRDYAAAIVSTVRESLVVLDTDLRIVSANQFFYEAFQLVAEKTENQLIYQIGKGEWDIPQLRSLLEDVLPQQTQFQSFEVEQTFEGIGHKFMRLNARRMEQIGDKPLILLVIEDVTQQKLLLAQEQTARNAAESANHAKDQFLSIVSHELRNPLNSLLGWVKLLRTQQMSEAKNIQALEAIERSAKAQNQLIGDLLDVSRITIGKMRLEATSIELKPIIEAAIEVIQLAAEAKQIHIESKLDCLTDNIIGDPIRLQQVMWNLLSNSIKFTPMGGRIEVTLKRDGSHAVVQVKDNGIGINAKSMPFIFERFHQIDQGKGKTNPGLGLGLSIVRHLVELHGGVIVASSPGEGQGATFSVRLPLQTDLAKNQEEPKLIQVSPTDLSLPEGNQLLTGVRVLLVDDEADIRHLFRIILEGYGVEVTEAESAKQALSLLTAHPNGYDVILSDIGLPQEDGYTFIREVRSLAPAAGGNIPAAALTAYAGTAKEAEALNAGFQIHLAKPIAPDQLVSVVAFLAKR